MRRPSEGPVEEEFEEDEAELKKVVTKGHWKLAGDKATIHAGMEKVQSYEEAFAKIQAETVRAAPIARLAAVAWLCLLQPGAMHARG